jgi:hypothetical protein
METPHLCLVHHLLVGLLHLAGCLPVGLLVHRLPAGLLLLLEDRLASSRMDLFANKVGLNLL